MIYEKIKDPDKTSPLFALLIDPEKHHRQSLGYLVRQAERAAVDLILVGGSLLSESLDQSILIIKEYTSIPVVLFPGNLMQVSPHADGIFFLSLISGRNPDLLIGNHVLSARMIKNSGLEVIPTGYILINGGSTSSVEYISNTKPIPANKTDIITATALAGELLGHKLIYLESGSGAAQPAYFDLVNEIKKQVALPLIVGGGLKKPSDLENLCQSEADMVVVGNAIEQNPDILTDMTTALRTKGR